jgi:predicted O-methyltransferase YrrM
LILLKSLHPVLQFLKHLLLEIDDHSLHSPYLFNLYTHVVRKAKKIPADPEIENLRQLYRSDHRIIGGKLYGAGSHTIPEKKPAVSHIARKGITRLKYSKLLLSLIDHFGCRRVLELGTSIGLNTLYLSKGRNLESLITFEGNTDLAGIARRNFETCSGDGIKGDKIKIITGEIDHTLPELLGEAEPVDFVFIDANHTASATLRYMEMLEPRLSSRAVVVIDDIYWSPDMTRAWRQICSSGVKALFLDFYQTGIVIRDPDAPEGYWILAY